MRPTGRGLVVAVIVILSLALSAAFGPRALNAVVAPLVVATLVGVLAVVRVDAPRVSRRPIENGTVGDRRTVEIAIEVDRPVPATVEDAVDDGLTATETVAETTLTGGTESYEVALEDRGVHEVGPLAITVTDVLGLVCRRFEYDLTERVLVRPRPYDLRGAREALGSLVAPTDAEDSREFGYLREYRPGDPRRDVDWKATAKRADGEPVVVEYDRRREQGAVEVAVGSVLDDEDGAARAAASVTRYVLEAGRAVEVTVPSEPPADVDTPLDALATLEAGRLAAEVRERADVVLETDAAGTTVVVDGREVPFDRLRGGRAGDRRGRVGGG